MGWTFPYTTPTRQALVEYLRRPARFGENLELINSSVAGNHHWYLIRERATGMHWVGLDLLQGSRTGWGYKDMDETVGPCAVDCPASYLAAAHTPREGWAAQWRERVAAYHADRRARVKPAPGVRVSYGGRVYRLIESAGPRLGWRVADELGQLYRMRAHQLRAAQFLGAASC